MVPNLLALSNYHSKIICVHMWPVEPHCQTLTAVSGRYWSGESRGRIQSIRKAAAVHQGCLKAWLDSIYTHSYTHTFRFKLVIRTEMIGNSFRLLVGFKVVHQKVQGKNLLSSLKTLSQHRSIYFLAPLQVFIAISVQPTDIAFDI